MFKDTMEEIGQPVIPSIVVNDVESAVDFANEIGYPVIIRPAFTLGGTGGGIVNNEDELREITANGLELSPITQVLVEKCIAGWKEIEYEVMRDKKGNVITVCSMENFDPVGVHTGDSIVIAPTVTLADKEYQMLRSAALNIISALGVEVAVTASSLLTLKPLNMLLSRLTQEFPVHLLLRLRQQVILLLRLLQSLLSAILLTKLRMPLQAQHTLALSLHSTMLLLSSLSGLSINSFMQSVHSAHR